jgi:hypothetical protein
MLYLCPCRCLTHTLSARGRAKTWLNQSFPLLPERPSSAPRAAVFLMLLLLQTFVVTVTNPTIRRPALARTATTTLSMPTYVRCKWANAVHIHSVAFSKFFHSLNFKEYHCHLLFSFSSCRVLCHQVLQWDSLIGVYSLVRYLQLHRCRYVEGVWVLLLCDCIVEDYDVGVDLCACRCVSCTNMREEERNHQPRTIIFFL